MAPAPYRFDLVTPHLTVHAETDQPDAVSEHLRSFAHGAAHQIAHAVAFAVGQGGPFAGGAAAVAPDGVNIDEPPPPAPPEPSDAMPEPNKLVDEWVSKAKDPNAELPIWPGFDVSDTEAIANRDSFNRRLSHVSIDPRKRAGFLAVRERAGQKRTLFFGPAARAVHLAYALEHVLARGQGIAP